MYFRENQGWFVFFFNSVCVVQIIPEHRYSLLVAYVRYLVSFNIATTPHLVSWHQVFLTGSLCALVYDLISYGMKSFCRKAGPLVSPL